MPRSHLVLVGHGQPSAPQDGETQIAAFAGQVAKHLPEVRVSGTTLAVPDRLERLETTGAPAVILPMFMTDGYFTTTALPKRLKNPQTRVLPAFGQDPQLVTFTQNWLSRELETRSWQAQDTVLFLAAHGSGRGTKPAIATRSFAQALHPRIPFAQIRCGFVEEPPTLLDVAQTLPAQSLCLPFFAFKRDHVTQDIPQALQKARFQGELLEPFGSNPDLPAFLAQRWLGVLGD